MLFNAGTRMTIHSYLEAAKRRDMMVGKPTTHQNGFIQLPIGEHARLHVWPDKSAHLVKQATNSPIHDHSFSFRSWVLVGNITNTLYNVPFLASDAIASHAVYIAKADGTSLRPIDTYAIPQIESVQKMPKGSVYELRFNEFHQTQWDRLTVTLMVKTARTGTVARVLCPINEPPDNEFDRETANPPEKLWELIDEGIYAAEVMLGD